MNILTTNHIPARMAAGLAGAALVLASFAPVTRAQSTADLEAQIAALLAQIASLQAQLGMSTTAGCGFSRDLTIGATGTDVTCLQNYLISRGFSIPAGATGYFGTQTQGAVASWQAANAVAPAAGYFGPISRAKYAALIGAATVPTNPTQPSTTLHGGEADLTSYNLRNEQGTVSENESDAELATATFDVDGGDINIQRVELEFDPSNSGLEDKPWQFFDRIMVLDDGHEIGSVNADDRDDWDEHGSGSSETYTITVSGLSDIVRDGDTAELTFAADIGSGIDTADLGQRFAIDVPDQGIRAVDAAGIQQYVGDDSDTVTISFGSEESGDLSIRESDDDPSGSILVADDSDTSDEYTVFAFDIRNSDDADATLDSLSIGVNASFAGGSVSGEDVSDIISRATLVADGRRYNDDLSDADTGGDEGSISFDDLDVNLPGDDTTTFELRIRLAPQNGNYDSGATLQFHVDSDDIDAEGEDTGDRSDVGGSATSATHTVGTSGIGIDARSTSQSVVTPGSDASKTYGTFTIKFDVTALDDDAYIASTTSSSGSATAGVDYQITGSSFSGTQTALLTSTARMTGGYYRVNEGSTETFTLTVTLDPNAAGTYEVDLTGVNFNTTPDPADASFPVDRNNGDFRTDPIYITT